jgi:hypothetical protein
VTVELLTRVRWAFCERKAVYLSGPVLSFAPGYQVEETAGSTGHRAGPRHVTESRPLSDGGSLKLTAW